MQTVNPAALGPEVLAQLRNPAPTTTKTVEDRDIKMQTVNRGAIPPSIQASLKDHRGDERQSKPLPQSPAQAARSYIPTRAAPSPAQNQQVAPPTQLQLWEREILASGEVKRKVGDRLCFVGPVAFVTRLMLRLRITAAAGYSRSAMYVGCFR
jgi:hypothetical protein